jgi:radical SAM superfamily enzyme YgiQ (UPF0313 family)
MLLIHPPVAKPSEPPAGIARLAGALSHHAIRHHLLDGNLEGLLWLLEQPVSANDTWSRRATRSLPQHLQALRDPTTYGYPDRYVRAVSDINRLLAVAGDGSGASVGLADYQHRQLSPLCSDDLIAAAGTPEHNPFFPWFSRRLPDLVEDFQLVGFSLNYLSQALTTFAMIGFIRRHYPTLTIILGGGLVTSWLQRPHWQNPFAGLIDELVAGPGEEMLLGRCKVQKASKISTTPEYGSLPLNDYLAPGVILPYSAASGCYWNRCSFCPERAEGNSYHPLPIQSVVSDLKLLSDRHRPRLIHLLDNAVTPALLRQLIEQPPGPPWYGFARIDEQLADLDFCLALRRSGCVMLKLGVESGDQRVLDRLQKGVQLDVISRALKNLRQAGIAVYCYLLFGTPAEDEAAARQTLDFVARHADAITFLNLAIFNMPALSPEAVEYDSEPFYDGDLSLYTSFTHPLGWDRRGVRRFVSQEFSRHPAVAPILRRDPPLFTSNHAPFLAQPDLFTSPWWQR